MQLWKGTILDAFNTMRNQVAQPYIGSLDYRFALLTKDVELLKEKVFKNAKRNKATEAQRFLLCYHFGFITRIIQYPNLSQKQKALVLSVMLDIDPDNARKFLSEVGKKEKPLLDTESNYTYLLRFFQDCGLSELASKANNILLPILNRKGK